MSLWGQFIHPITAHFRKKRGAMLLRLWPDIASYRICDLGGSRHFWEKVGLSIPHDRVTIYNIDEGTSQGTEAGIADDIAIVYYDGTTIPAADGYFDLVVCNSVLEHVPVTARVALCREMVRVGKRLFVQTPAFSFPIEPHFVMPFVHWLPKRIAFPFIYLSPWRLLSRPSRSTIRNYFFQTTLLNRRELQTLLPEGRVIDERLLGMTKSHYVAIASEGSIE